MIFTSDGEVTLLSAPTTSGMLVGTVTVKVEAAAVRVMGVLPVPGDEIVGFITRGRGISIHRTDCVNIMNLPEIERARVIEADWEASSLEEKSDQKYMGEIKIFANNRTGLLADISRVFTENDIDVRAMNSRTSKQEIATIEVSFLTQGKPQMVRIIEKIRAIDNVIDIERTTG